MNPLFVLLGYVLGCVLGYVVGRKDGRRIERARLMVHDLALERIEEQRRGNNARTRR